MDASTDCTAYYTSTATAAATASSSSSGHVASTSVSTSQHGNNREKRGLLGDMASVYSRAATQERPMFSSSSLTDPFVQTDNRLTEDYSRRIHCYISETLGDANAPRDHMPPPMLPPFASLRSEQGMPFWRPPRVLQRDPHYNQAAPHLRTSPPPQHADQRRRALSFSRQVNTTYSQCRPSHPQLGTYHAQLARDQGSDDYSSSNSNSNDYDYDIDTAAADVSYSHVTSREPMSIACLVDTEDSVTQRSVVLPQISNLVSTDNGSPRHISAIALSQLRRPTAHHHTGQQPYVPPLSPRKRSYGATEAAMSLHKMARVETRLPPSLPSPAGSVADSRLRDPWCASTTSLSSPNLVVITCYHASVAQKSYGGEKRFLCPPPAVLMRGEGRSARIAHHSPMLLSVITDANIASSPSSPVELTPCRPSQSSNAPQSGDTVCASGSGGATNGSENSSIGAQPSSSAHAPLDCQTSFNERNVALFKSLHVTGMQKAKSFRLRLDLLAPSAPCEQPYAQEPRPLLKSQVYASLESDSVAIISKPSKKTAKARNQSTCIRAGSLISLFNRINSQTFRTKYLNVDHLTNRWVAQSHNWSPLEVVVMAHRDGNTPAQLAPEASDCRPLYYGSEIVLVESRRNFRSPPMIIHKVERGRYVENACSPVSQMQKIALQLKPMAPGEPLRFLKADAGHYGPTGDASAHARFDDPDGSPELTFETLQDTSTAENRPFGSSQGDDSTSELDDAFCWTIVGISAFTYS
ncbi:hypothetical protein IWW38_003393, partial [Coemansia aciculifera]